MLQKRLVAPDVFVMWYGVRLMSSADPYRFPAVLRKSVRYQNYSETPKRRLANKKNPEHFVKSTVMHPSRPFLKLRLS